MREQDSPSANAENTVRVRTLSGPAAVTALMRDADQRLQHVLGAPAARLNPDERRQLAEAAQYLRAALRCLGDD